MQERGCENAKNRSDSSRLFRFTCPTLYKMAKAENKKQDAYAVLRECPTQLVARETPWIYGALNAHVHAENGALNPLECTPYLQSALRVIGSEKSRLWEIERKQEETRQQAKSMKARAR